MSVNRIRYTIPATLRHVGEQPKKILWENVKALMVEKYGAENLNRLARESKLGPGSVSRIKAMRTSVGIDVVAKAAKALGVEPWQLLMRQADKRFLTVLQAWNKSGERGRDLLTVAADAAMRVQDDNRKAGKADEG